MRRLWRLRQALKELGEEFADRLKEPTNTLLGISCQDEGVRRLAVLLNGQLLLLQKSRHRYEQGDAELRTAVTNLSHDIRTPLTAICGYLDLLLREPWSTSAESRQAYRYLEQIKERAEAMKRLTEELFSYFILSAKPPEQEGSEELSLNAALEESLAGFYGAFAAAGLTPEVSLPEAPVRRRLNREALLRIFDNILGNALKYGGGRLRVSLTPEGEICFANPAPGLDPVLAGRLFDRFFTVEAGREATGLGLSIARLLTERLGGGIAAEYREGWLAITLHF